MTDPVDGWEHLLHDLLTLIPKPLRPRNPDLSGWAARVDACVRASSDSERSKT